MYDAHAVSLRCPMLSNTKHRLLLIRAEVSGSRSLNGDLCVWSETSTLKNAFQQRRVSSSDRNFCLVPNQNANFNCGDVIAARYSLALAIKRFSREFYAFPPATACHCQGHLLNTVVIRYWQSRLPVTHRIWNSPPKLTCSSAREKFPAVLFLVDPHIAKCGVTFMNTFISEQRSIWSWRQIKLHLNLNLPLAEIQL